MIMLAARILAVMGGGDGGDAEMNEATKVARKQAVREGGRSNGGGEVEAARLVVQVMMARLVVTKAALTEEARETVVRVMRATMEVPRKRGWQCQW